MKKQLQNLKQENITQIISANLDTVFIILNIDLKISLIKSPNLLPDIINKKWYPRPDLNRQGPKPHRF